MSTTVDFRRCQTVGWARSQNVSIPLFSLEIGVTLRTVDCKAAVGLPRWVLLLSSRTQVGNRKKEVVATLVLQMGVWTEEVQWVVVSQRDHLFIM